VVGEVGAYLAVVGCVGVGDAVALVPGGAGEKLGAGREGGEGGLGLWGDGVGGVVIGIVDGGVSFEEHVFRLGGEGGGREACEEEEAWEEGGVEQVHTGLFAVYGQIKKSQGEKRSTKKHDFSLMENSALDSAHLGKDYNRKQIGDHVTEAQIDLYRWSCKANKAVLQTPDYCEQMARA